MRRLPVLVTLVLLLAMAVPPVLSSMWKENGYIGFCGAIGCTGRKILCSTRSYSGSDGSTITHYCYMDP